MYISRDHRYIPVLAPSCPTLRPSDRAEGLRRGGEAAMAARLATDAVDLAFSTAGSTSAGKRGTRLEKYYRDTGFYKTHIGAQYDVFHLSQGRVGLGLPSGGM